MKIDGELYQSCVEPEFAHNAAGGTAYFPPLISLVHVNRGGSDALELRLRRNWPTYPANVKESIVLEDVINVLCGSDGTLYHVEHGSYVVHRSPILDRSLSHQLRPNLDAENDATLCMMAEEILELAVMQRKVQDFVQDNERGFVVLSLCEVLNVLLQELQSRIAQFDESQRNVGMGLQRFKLYIQPAIHTFEVLQGVVAKSRITGAALLNTLAATCQLYGTGDARRGLANHLMKQAMEAYCHLVDPWINFGELYDPCQEFFVVPKGPPKGGTSEDEQVFGIDWDRVPNAMKDIAETILNTGMYIRILARSKGKALPNYQPLQFTSVEEFKAHVATLHQVASDELVKYIVADCNLMEMLESVHRFLLLSRADYVTNILADIDHNTLNESINLNFQEAVAQSSLRNDAYKHLYVLEVVDGNAPLGLSARSDRDISKRLKLSFTVEWPMQIFFSEDVMAKYQTAFSFFLQLKQTEHALSRIWLMHMKWKRLPLMPSAQLRLNYTFVIIERMLFLCRNIAYLCTVEVTERNFNLLLQTYENHLKTDKAQQSFSFIVSRHQQFVDQIIKRCMIDDETIAPSISRALSLCNIFATQVLEFLEQRESDSGATRQADRHAELERATKFTTDLLHNEGYIAMVGTASHQFDKHLRALLALLQGAEERHQSSLPMRLTYNGYFT
ncbi:gamma-tubulin complex component 2 [Babesia ovata]|uniref:Spindle pole body component n=1 Tax=Babesia ovata TaxID=189622 RepID=A0A2H6KFR4_9APIC|nr:gamma-tubulin complex component 2 [Babesia ovata]GBE61835.1 gamma-tubulin complex component 2 [Babesia ovata]